MKGALGMRKVKVAAVLVVGALVALSGAQTSASADGPVPIKWGASVQPNTGETLANAQTRFQGDVGRPLATVRDFLAWDSKFPAAYEKGMQKAGTTILLSVATKTKKGVPITWASIANAQPGDPVYTMMQSWADRIRDFGSPIYVTMQHEPEVAGNAVMGTSADYIAAWQAWVTMFRAEGATNVKYLWITTAFAYTVKPTDRRLAPNWYPGDAYVDAIGADAYNWFSCRPSAPKTPWYSLAQLIAGMQAFSLLHPTQELWVTEFASVEDPATPGRRASWISDAEALFQSPGYERFVGVLYFEENKPPCDWRVENTPDALAALGTMGADPFYSG
jgi:Glycosyl hydrolase family 26